MVKIVRRQENILLPSFIATIIDNSGRVYRWDAMLGVDRPAFSVEFAAAAAVVATVSSRFVPLSSVPSLTLKPCSCLVDLEMKTMSRDGGREDESLTVTDLLRCRWPGFQSLSSPDRPNRGHEWRGTGVQRRHSSSNKLQCPSSIFSFDIIDSCCSTFVCMTTRSFVRSADVIEHYLIEQVWSSLMLGESVFRSWLDNGHSAVSIRFSLRGWGEMTGKSMRWEIVCHLRRWHQCGRRTMMQERLYFLWTMLVFLWRNSRDNGSSVSIASFCSEDNVKEEEFDIVVERLVIDKSFGQETQTLTRDPIDILPSTSISTWNTERSFAHPSCRFHSLEDGRLDASSQSEPSARTWEERNEEDTDAMSIVDLFTCHTFSHRIHRWTIQAHSGIFSCG